nr:hypothetical protein [uncultured Desulfobacter sp.]
MKKIVKGGQPEALLQWRAYNNARSPQNIRYGKANFPGEAVMTALLLEQGYLCAYTLLLIDENKAHVEHLKPQSICRQEDEEREQNGNNCIHEDVEWSNMVACFPQPGAKHPGYGAWKKDNWWCSQNFISPLAQTCESKFRYCKDGSIQNAVDGDIPARKTIKKLKLNCDPLKELRSKAIKAAGFHKRSKNPVRSIKAVERRIDQLKQKQGGRYAEFCTVLEHVGFEWLGYLKKCASQKGHRAKAKVNR